MLYVSYIVVCELHCCMLVTLLYVSYIVACELHCCM